MNYTVPLFCGDSMKKRWVVVLVILAVLFAVVTIRTARFTTRQMNVTAVSLPPVNVPEITANLSAALRYRTISTQDPSEFSPDEFVGLRKFLEERFPAIHSGLSCEIIGDYSLLYTWKGSDTSLKPVLLMAHMDVVPVESEKSWTHGPFSGSVADGFIWGRGALDDKASMMGIFEAVEGLLAAQYKPRRTIYLAFGHNEEVLGSGAAAIAATLKSRGVQLESVLDEGSAIISGMIPGISKDVALIGTAEKGYMSVRLTVTMEGGHSSMPPRHSAVGVLSKAIVELEKRRVPARLGDPVAQMFDYVGPELPLSGRIVFANQWLTGPLIRQILASGPATNAMIRTTTAPTMIEGSKKENVLPATATAIVNFRILPGDTTEEILAFVRNTVRDERVHVEAMSRGEPSPVAAVPSPQFDLLQRTAGQVFSGIIVAPTLVIGATDSRSYEGLTKNIYRFFPVAFRQSDLDRVHGANERIGVEDYARAVQFYIQYIRNTTS